MYWRFSWGSSASMLMAAHVGYLKAICGNGATLLLAKPLYVQKQATNTAWFPHSTLEEVVLTFQDWVMKNSFKLFRIVTLSLK